MGSKSEWNRTVWPAWAAAQRAADELIVALPDTLPKPASPYRPFSPRAVAWFIAAADHAGNPRIANARDRVRLALGQLRVLGTAPITADVKKAFAWFHDTVGDLPQKDMTTETHPAALVASGRITASQPAGWRVIPGVPETARATGRRLA